jgi:hypothetical protein
MPDRAMVAAVDVEQHARLLSLNEGSRERVGLRGVGGLRQSVRTPVPTLTRESRRVVDAPRLVPAWIVPAWHPTILLPRPMPFRPPAAFVGGPGLCHHLCMAKTVIVKLTDDIDGGDADETVQFALDGKAYEVDLSAANASKLRAALKPYIDSGRGGAGVRTRNARPSGPAAEITLYSRLKDDEKRRFRAWANMPTARRISDARVESWVAAGRP